MDPGVRSALLGLGLGFCAVFGILTLYAAVKLGLGLSNYGDLLALGFVAISLLVIGMIAAGLYRGDPQPAAGRVAGRRRGEYARALATVHHLNCGTMCPRGARLLAGRGGLLEPTKLIAHCLLIESGGSLVLVDTGFGLGDVRDPKRLGQPFRAMVRPRTSERETAVRQVAALGLDPAAVRDIVVTHLDLDHAGGLRGLPRRRASTCSPPSWRPRWTRRCASGTRYRSAQWAHGPTGQQVRVDGDAWFGFESVRVLPGPGRGGR